VISTEMKKNTKIIQLFSAFILLFTSNGCGINSHFIDQSDQQVSFSQPTVNPTFATTVTHTSTNISTSTYVHLHTPTINSTSTIPIIPTLPAHEAHLRLLDLLSTNGNCHLPCFWGITPGKNSLLDGLYILSPLESIASLDSCYISRCQRMDAYYYEGILKISASILLFTYQEITNISSIQFIAESYIDLPDPANPGHTYLDFVFDSTAFQSRLAFYMLPQILSEYGAPSSVSLWTLPGPNAGLFYAILMYPDLGFAIHYTTRARISGSNVLGCISNSHIDLYLFPSGNAESFYELLPKNYKGVESNLYKPLEEVTSLSMDQFYHIFRQPTDRCIVTPSTNWTLER
jgi:hypothetical protein